MPKSTNCDDNDADCNVVDHVDSGSSTAAQSPTSHDHVVFTQDSDEVDAADEQADRVPELPADVDEVDQPTVALPPDGGWGWTVVVAAFFANLIVDGVTYTFGIIMPELLDHFEAGKGKTALVGSLIPGVYLAVGKSTISQDFFSVQFYTKTAVVN